MHVFNADSDNSQYFYALFILITTNAIPIYEKQQQIRAMLTGKKCE